MRGFDARLSPLEPREVLAQFLRASVWELTYLNNWTSALLFRTLTAGKAVLVVLDNTATPDQVRPLLPATPAGLVLVTSRLHLAGLVVREGADPLVIGRLSLDKSVQLLGPGGVSRHLASEPEAARELAVRCGQLPLARMPLAAIPPSERTV